MDTEQKAAAALRWMERGWKLSALAAVLIFAVEIFEWPLVSLLTVFIAPFLQLAAWLFLFVSTVVALIGAIRYHRVSALAWRPLTICLVAAVIAWFNPFNAIYLSANFHLLRSARTSAAQQILQGPEGHATNNGGRGNLVTLPARQHALSEDGEVIVDHRDGKTFILFFTFRGILDRFSGYVYSPTDTPPAKDQFLGDGIEVKKVAPNWYWYAS